MVASFDAFMDALLPKEMIKSRVIKICSDETLNLDELSVKLAQCGYDREIEVAGPGQFAVRGGILDVYPLTEELPVRIELGEMRWILFEPLIRRRSDLSRSLTR